MITKQEWDSLMAEIDQLDAQLRQLRGSSEPQENDPVQKSLRVPDASKRSGQPEQPEQKVTSPAVSDGLAPWERTDMSPRPFPFSNSDSSWNASALYLSETQDPQDEEDLQCYMIRKRYTNVQQDGELDRMESLKPVPVSAWSDGRAAGLPKDQLYLQIGKHLTEGQIADTTYQEMILLGNAEDAVSPGMRQFYRAFTLLQGTPSEQGIKETLRELEQIPEGYSSDAGVWLLKNILDAVLREQKARKDRQDKYYQEKQSAYDSRQQQAEKAFDKAKQKTDRWRK